MISMLEFRDSHDNCGSLVDHDALQAVLLVEVSIEVLLHGLSSLVVHVHALVVVLYLLQVDVGDQISNLLQSVCDAVRVLFVAFQRAVVWTLHLERGELLFSESRRDKIATEVVLLRIGLNALVPIRGYESRGSGLILALQFPSNDALNL